jgi:iron complex transport system substrate-binding protein
MSARRTNLVNGAALVLALALGAIGGYDRGPRTTAELPVAAVTSVRKQPLPGGGFGIADASGRLVPLRPYHRIASTNMLADRLLLELAEPDRVLAVSTSSAQSPVFWRYAGKPTVDGMGPLEGLIALKPDLVLLNVFGNEAKSEKLRAAGIEVFNLGELRGLRTLLPTAEIVGELLGAPARGRALALAYQARLQRVAAPLGTRPRRRALYLVVIAGNIYGGTRGTSYHDVLVAAGLDDVAAARHRDWPQYRPEELAALDPDLLVTKAGLADAVCVQPGLDHLRACREPGHVLGLPESLIDDPGLGMLDAAEQLFALAYPGVQPPP